MNNRNRDEGNLKIEPGMLVEATEADVGEDDVSKPKVTEVVENAAGEVEKVKVKKGVIFQKEIEIPAERIQTVEETPPEDPTPGKVVVEAKPDEVAELRNTGSETLQPEQDDTSDLIEEVEEALPTAEGLRRKELENFQKRKVAAGQPEGSTEQAETEVADNNILKTLGPGFLAGMAGNDSSAVTSYSVDGATNGYGHLWLLLISTPIYQAVQYTCAKVGRLTQKSLSEILKEQYGGWVAVLASLILIVANLALIAADLVAIGTGLELITGLSWLWFVGPVAIGIWYITVYQNFNAIKKIFTVMSLVFITYLVTAVLAHPNWGEVLKNTFVPQLDFSFDSISSAVALLGATISPYTMFWQVQGEKEEKRPGNTRQQLRFAALDIASGVLSGNLIAYAIIVCTATTIFTKHGQIKTAADAAGSLEPLLGVFAKYLFAFGFIGAGIVAIPVLLASTAYAITGTLGWPAGLSKKPWQSEGFYLILTVAFVGAVVIALLGLDPVQLMFWANVLNGTLAPVLVILIILVANNRKVVGKHPMSLITNLGLVLAALLMSAATILLFYGLLTDKGS
ncbi:MAG TPA: divalent metal cation transporter [Chloroflexia bacterium]|nr:divalent metal cation transporter [Chloroflexia bacterium]